MDGIVPCRVQLRREYQRVGSPNGDMETNLVKECDNTDVPDYDYGICANNTYMCCWTKNDGEKGMKDNTVRPVLFCYFLFSHAPAATNGIESTRLV